MKKITVAIDGYSGTGKGTTAKILAAQLGYTYLDTGAMYRAVTFYAMRHGLLESSDQEKAAILDTVDLAFSYNEQADHFEMMLDGENIEKQIRSPDLALQMHHIVTCIPLRKKMIALQRKRCEQGGIIVDGRDIGTHVYPEAPVKIFMVCDVDTRVTRRLKQLTEQGIAADYDTIRQEIVKRDTTDYLGPHAVNKKADDAIVIDTSDTTIAQQVAQIKEIIETYLDS